MKNSYRFAQTKPCSAFPEIIRPILTGIAIGAVIMGLFFLGKASGRNEILRSEMWTDSCGTIYIDTLYGGVVAHENLAETVYGRR